MEVYLTSPKMEGHIIAVYEPLPPTGDMKLTGLLLPQTQLSDVQYQYLVNNLAYQYPLSGKVCGVLDCSLSLDSAEQLVKSQKGKSKRNKIGLFCGLYKNRFGVNYTVTGKDTALAGKYSFDARLLNIFFENEFWWNKDRYTISTYVNNINTLELIAKGGNTASNFPKKYSPEFERSISGATLSEYWEHLRASGWKAVKHEQSNKIICWSNGIESINTN